jgi:GTP cyclohydrolase II
MPTTTITTLPAEVGTFGVTLIEQPDKGEPHFVLVREEDPSCTPDVRIHSECLTGDVFGSHRCDCGPQLRASCRHMATSQHAYLFYLRQEGRGIGLKAKMLTYALQDQGYDTVEANEQLGFAADARSYNCVAEFLIERGIKRVRLMTNNPDKCRALRQAGIEVERVPLDVGAHELNARYRQTKRDYFGHYRDEKEEKQPMKPKAVVTANVIFVNDIARSEKWFTDVFGMEVVNRNPPEFLEMSLGASSFFIETNSDRREPGFEGTPPGGRCSIVFGVTDIEEFCREAVAAGARMVVKPVRQHWGGINAVVADPDGNEFILDQLT